MVKAIIRDPEFLCQPSPEAERTDLQVGRDLDDTLKAHRGECVGIAANMIGVRKRIIVMNPGMGPFNVVMYNPVIVRKEKPYMTEEGCLSLEGTRKAERFQEIEVEFRDARWEMHRMSFSGFPAQIIQHEVDHLNGILI